MSAPQYTPIHSESESLPKRTILDSVCDGLFCFCICIVMANSIFQLARYDPHAWFRTAVLPVETVKAWSESYRDENLHLLSRWDGFNTTQWRAFVSRGYLPLEIPPDQHFRFLEIGVGVGAWSRSFLQVFANASGEGVDLEPDALAIAAAVLPPQRMQLRVANMLNIADFYRGAEFDYVFIPGTLCYTDNLAQARSVLDALRRDKVLKRGGKLSATMLASADSDKGSCVTRIPKDFWTTIEGYSVISIEEMDAWHLPHAFGRYAVYLSLHH